MPLNGEPATARGLPVALAAITVDGRCRERSPVDAALFGPDGDRFITRFVIAGEGEALLARAMTDAAAEAIAELRTPSGIHPFRISLWRQRSGEKIRITAAFAEAEPEPAVAPIDTLGGHLAPARALAPVSRALLGLSERIRRTLGVDGLGDATDLMATAWRVAALSDEILSPRPRTRGPSTAAEIDLALLVRRVIRLAEAAGAGPDVTIDGPTTTDAPFPRLLGDASSIWTLIDHLLGAAIEACEAKGQVLVALSGGVDGLTLRVESRADVARPTASGPGLDQVRLIAASHEARLVIDRAPDAPFRAQVAFPSQRCLAAL